MLQNYKTDLRIVPHLWEIAGGWRAVAEAVLRPERVVEGRVEDMTSVYISGADVKLLP